ncbi:50S ribosomal protein L33 [Sporosarcina sp. HYO08]|nr:50S ribosomal protein L33 [Sporosarcina sp. HYO08]
MSTKIILSCETCGSRNYSVPARGKQQTERLILKKYCKHCNKQTVHKQTA